jgi:SWI/SNF-related matrix-associated actin-dependent regulator 1 of chromatin subfamily A
MLAETDKTYHVYGKLSTKQQSKMYFLPKTQVYDDPYFEPITVNVDFTPYNDVLAKQGKKLYQHQEDGIKFLLSRNGSILADDMGLGKSIQSIIAALESGAKKILVVCPSSTKINWEREINVFCNETAIVDGKKWKEAKFTIINFDILKNFHSLKDKKNLDVELNRELANANFDLAIIDEAHYLKNNDSIRGKIMVELATKHSINKVWLLTGTPVANRPMDFFNLLKIIKSPIAENWKHYAVRYCEGKQFFRTLKNGTKKQIWLTDGASNLEELASKTKNIILRRLKTEVLDMPDKVVTPMHQQLDKKGWGEYDRLWDEYVTNRILEDKKTNEEQKSLVELILLRRFIAAQAIPYTIEMAENAIELGRKVIIFTSFTEELEILQNHFGKIAVKHNGPMTTTQKQKSVDAFQENAKIKVFIGNIKSAGVGITLTDGTVVIFNSFDWVPGSNEQAEDRAFRIGQKNDVNVYYQLFDNTISTRMWEMLNNKKDVISTIMGEKILSEDEITTLLVEQINK